MDIFKIISDETCSTKLTAKNKQECLRKLAHTLSARFREIPEDDIFNALWEREKLGSTGFENGVAIPHAKVKGIKDFVMCISVSRKGIDFKSIDGKKTHIFFTIIGPEENPQDHLKILAQVSRISRNPNARKELLSSRSPLAVKEAFLRYVTAAGIKEKNAGKKKLLMIILYENRYFEDIINLFLEKGIQGANVLESSGIKDILSSIPLFSDFLNFLGERSHISKTIMTVVNESEIPGIVEGIEEIMGDLDKHTGAAIIALDIFLMKG